MTVARRGPAQADLARLVEDQDDAHGPGAGLELDTAEAPRFGSGNERGVGVWVCTCA